MISVVLCTHNPRRDYLERTLTGLRAQTLPREAWELLVIDNGSETPLAGELDLSWHPGARVIREDELGLTPARLRGFAEGRGDLFVMVDDDNVLAPDYLAEAARIHRERPHIGAFGPYIKQVFESEPEAWTRPYHSLLGWQAFAHDTWACKVNVNLCAPCGAGMCVRREVAEAFVRGIAENPFRKTLGRRGKELTSGEDTDIALCACDLGLGNGLFQCLQLQHLIPPNRLKYDYLLNICEKLALAGFLIPAIRDPHYTIPVPGKIEALFHWLKLWRIDPTERAFERARLRARKQARDRLAAVRASLGGK